jgi:metallophosphoesterase (TIGR00282 family)
MSNAKTIRIMFFGDLVGPSGLAMFHRWAPRLKEKHNIDMIVVNGENTASNGRGISPEIVDELSQSGASVITSGNHVWANKKIYTCLEESGVLLRPANYPSSCPGKGYTFVDIGGTTIAVINLQGRVFMHENLDCPFRTIESLLTMVRHRTNIIFVDFHAEATSEKKALGAFLDGKISGIVGTHTHVQTADERVMPGGTAYITDLGCVAAQNSALGVQSSIIIERFLTQMPVFFKLEKHGPMELNAAWIEVDVETGKALAIERITILDGEPVS